MWLLPDFGFRQAITASVIFICLAWSQIELNTLHSGWEFRQAGTEIWYPAQIPGTVHTDLMSNELIPDPFYEKHEKDVQWVETENWEYRTEFDLTGNALRRDKIELIFEGLDTYADVYLNNMHVFQADNMHRSWSATVKPYLKVGRNELSVYFHSPVVTGQKKLEAYPYLVPASNEPVPIGEQTSAFTRKAQYHYGWDWCPRLVTSGIWRPVYLRLWDWARITDGFFRLDSLNEKEASYTAEIEIESGYELKCSLDLLVDGQPSTEMDEISLEKGMNTMHIPFSIISPSLWWPNGLGEQNLYEVKIVLKKGDETLSVHSEKIGVRTIELVQEPDSAGTSFYFKVNGEPVFMKGANYIPPDFFIPRVIEKYERVVEDAAQANMNMLRVWGGAVYENDEFYQLCDEKGILIWQDFMFSILMVPNIPGYLENIRNEAEENVRRLRDHPSLALWCGNNENLNGWFKWGWQESYSLSSADSLELWNTYEKVFHQMLPGIVAENDPGKPYWSSSPSSAFGELENEKSGDRHEWGVWFGRLPFSHYADNPGRFVSEYGLQSLPDLGTIQKMDTTQVFWRDTTSALDYRQRSNMPWIEPGYDGFDMIRFYTEQIFSDHQNFRSLVYLSQLTQAEALKTAIESHRRNKPVTMGSLFWQIDDVWPTVSWSTVDYYGNWKPAHYAVRDAFQEVLLAPVINNDHLEVWAVSDRLSDVSGLLVLEVKGMDGRTFWKDKVNVHLRANTSQVVYIGKVHELLAKANPETVFLELRFVDENELLDEALFYFVPPMALKLSNPLLKTKIEKIDGRFEIRIKSASLARNLSLSVGGAKGRFSDNYFDLPPGREQIVIFYPGKLVDNITENLEVESLFHVLNQ